MSSVPARWERIARAVEIRNQCQGDALTLTLIVGNGDVKDLADARAKVAATKCDGVMLGRAIFGNPWLFSGREDEPSPAEKKEALVRHLKLFDELLTGTTNFSVMKKHFKAYIGGFDDAKELRIKLMETGDVKSAIALLTDK